MSCSCGCCEGVHAITPQYVANRPGLTALRTRIGTYSSFFETLRARLSSADYPELAGLRTRDPSDPVIALLDGVATMADVLTFYQERIANEAYLRTATERRSLVELARLIGYVPRPGVAASAYLAFGLEKDAAPTTIPRGTKANSVPNPGETMEAFETGDALHARVEWGAIRPRSTAPQTPQTIVAQGLYLAGTDTKLAAGDMLVVRVPVGGVIHALPVPILAVEVDHDRGWTRVVLQGTQAKVGETALAAASNGASGDNGQTPPVVKIPPVIGPATLPALAKAPSVPPRASAQLARNLASSFAAKSDTQVRLVTQFQPKLAAQLYSAVRNAAPAIAQPIEVHALRIAARTFANNAPPKLIAVGSATTPPKFGEWSISDAAGIYAPLRLSLEGDFTVADDSFVVIQRPGFFPRLLKGPLTLTHGSHMGYGLSGKSLSVAWSDAVDAPWLVESDDFNVIRGTRVWLGSEKLKLAEAPIDDDVKGARIELDGLYDGLESGRWLIVEGERTDVLDGAGNPIPGIRAAELVMLAGVTQRVRDAAEPNQPDPAGSTGTVPGGKPFAAATLVNVPAKPQGPLPGDTYHSTIALAGTTEAGTAGLAYAYKRSTVTIYANVAAATHGETRTETLGSGDASLALQQFQLKQIPLTWVSAPTPSGVASTLQTRVDDVLWHERPTLAAAGPADRVYVTRTGDDDKVTLTFGNGRRGARLPTGRENVRAVYRSGIGKAGNLAARQISLLASRPLGVKDVINPIRSSGGTDRESAEAIRRNAPIALLALDRLVSTSDYADFARNFGGIGKAAAWREGARVVVAIAGVDDAPIDPSSDVYLNLKDALHRFGDAFVPTTLKVRRRLALLIEAGIRHDPDYLWDAVEAKVRAALLDTFAFDRRNFGAPAFLAEAFRAIQSVKGVVSSDIDVFTTVNQEEVLAGDDGLASDRLVPKQRVSADPDAIAWLSPAVADTLILRELAP